MENFKIELLVPQVNCLTTSKVIDVVAENAEEAYNQTQREFAGTSVSVLVPIGYKKVYENIPTPHLGEGSVYRAFKGLEKE